MAEVHPYPEKRLDYTWYWYGCNVVNPLRILYGRTTDTTVGRFPTAISYNDLRQRFARTLVGRHSRKKQGGAARAGAGACGIFLAGTRDRAGSDTAMREVLYMGGRDEREPVPR